MEGVLALICAGNNSWPLGREKLGVPVCNKYTHRGHFQGKHSGSGEFQWSWGVEGKHNKFSMIRFGFCLLTGKIGLV